MKRGLLNLQFWRGDLKDAADLASLLSRIPNGRHGDYDILLTNRFDCPPMHGAVIGALTRRFDVFTYKSTTQATGWPAGCNALWLDSMQWIAARQGFSLPRYKWVLCMEADDCPLAPNWLDTLDSEWDKYGMRVVGDVVQFPAWHVNGNAMFSAAPDFMQYIRGIKRLDPKKGWDFYLAEQFRRWGWAKTPAIVSVWNTLSTDVETVKSYRDQGAVMLHGVKDDSVRWWAERELVAG